MAALTAAMISSGHQLINALDKASVTVPTAYWSLDEDSDQWRLVLAPPKVKQIGHRKAYSVVGHAVRTLNRREITMSNVSVVDQNDAVPRAVRSFIRTGPNTHNVRVTHCSVNNITTSA
jgi:hypothetical protein